MVPRLNDVLSANQIGLTLLWSSTITPDVFLFFLFKIVHYLGEYLLNVESQLLSAYYICCQSIVSMLNCAKTATIVL